MKIKLVFPKQKVMEAQALGLLVIASTRLRLRFDNQASDIQHRGVLLLGKTTTILTPESFAQMREAGAIIECDTISTCNAVLRAFGDQPSNKQAVIIAAPTSTR